MSDGIDDGIYKPWWRALSFWGWLKILFAAFATYSVGIGLLTGEVILVLPSRRSEQIYYIVPSRISDVFWGLMVIYALASMFIWSTFFLWMVKRREEYKEWVAQHVKNPVQRK